LIDHKQATDQACLLYFFKDYGIGIWAKELFRVVYWKGLVVYVSACNLQESGRQDGCYSYKV